VNVLIIGKEPDRDDSFVAMGSNVSFTFVLVENIVTIIIELNRVVNNRGIVAISIIIIPPNVNLLIRPLPSFAPLPRQNSSHRSHNKLQSGYILVRLRRSKYRSKCTARRRYIVFELFVKVILLHREKILQVHQVLSVG